jgi:RNA polymerase sigma factor (sigma-70 family)
LEAVEYQDIHRPVIERCRLGDRKAQYELYKLYAKAMFNVSLRICGDTAEAEDVLQEAFLSAFQHLHTFQYQASFGSWLKRIVINQAISTLRKRKFQTASLEEELQVAHTDEGIQEEDLQYELGRVKIALKHLPEGYKVVLSLYLFEGYDHGEIAQILGITEATSKTQYMRAKKRLIELMKR